MHGKDLTPLRVVLLVQPQDPEHSVTHLAIPGRSPHLRPSRRHMPRQTFPRRSKALRQDPLEEMNLWPATLLPIAVAVELNDQAANTLSLLCRPLQRNQLLLNRLSLLSLLSLNGLVGAILRLERVRGLSFQVLRWDDQRACVHLRGRTTQVHVNHRLLRLVDLGDTGVLARSPPQPPITMTPPVRVSQKTTLKTVNMCPGQMDLNPKRCPKAASERIKNLPICTARSDQAPEPVRIPFPL